MTELLLPAGNLEKLEYAIAYGADAVYFGMVDFSLRALKSGEIIDEFNIKSAVDMAHKFGRKAYMTANIFAFDEDIKNLESKIDLIKEANPDAIIFSDFGVFNLLKNKLDIPLHVSTQTNTLNSDAVKFWRDLGAKRVILARELSKEQILEIRKNVPDIELEIFVHGAQCMSFSGRCLLSDFMTEDERKANHGNCAQPCRWNYKLLEETRPGQYYEVEQFDKYTAFMSPKDLCLVEFLPEMIDAGIDSFKIEGRTKSTYYVSCVAKAYKSAMNEYREKGSINIDYYKNELLKVRNRGYTTGFFTGKSQKGKYAFEKEEQTVGNTFCAQVLDKTQDGIKVLVKNNLNKTQEYEYITPEEAKKVKITKIVNQYELEDEIAKTNEVVTLTFDNMPETFKYGLLRY